jgi:hypothetical protein
MTFRRMTSPTNGREKTDLETRQTLGVFQSDLLLQIRNGLEGSTLQFECSIEAHMKITTVDLALLVRYSTWKLA